MKKCYQLVGVPGSGKTTWIKEQKWARDCVIASTDFWVELEAIKQNKSYSEVFENYMSTAVRLMLDTVVSARNQGLDIIWDQTSTTVASRRRKFLMLPDYEHHAIVFDTPEIPELIMRLDARPGKVIPDSVMQDFINDFEQPSLTEGFTTITYADT